MNGVFVDTSGLYAWLDRADRNHGRAAEAWRSLLDSDLALVTTNYALTETVALCQARAGLELVRRLLRDVLPLLTVQWVSRSDHEAAMEELLALDRREVSFVDCVSFGAMRHLGLTRAFATDSHFQERGFQCIP